MNCPKCNRPHAEADAFCRFCGTPLFEKPKKRRGNLLAPWIAVVCMSVLGLILYFIQPLSSFENDTPWFTVEDGVLYFDPYLYEGSQEITVPSAIGGEPILELSDGCFSDMTQITAIHLPDSLQVIGDYAFSYCTALRGIEIPEGVTQIGRGAFWGCASLEAVTVPDTVSHIGEDAFFGCEKLRHIFYNGENANWKALYSQHINLYTHVYCTDGDFLHR